MSDNENSTLKQGISAMTSGFQIKDVFATSLKNWYWFIISVVVCLAVASLYIKQTNPVYSSSAYLMIKDMKGNKRANTSLPGNFNNLTLFGGNSTLLDEKAMIESPDLMEEVVTRLNLQTSYTQEGMISTPVLYGSRLPINVSFPQFSPKETASLNVTLTSDGMVKVNSIKVNGRNLPVPSKPLAFGSEIKTPSGPVKIESTPFYHKGETPTINISRSSLSAARGAYGSRLLVTTSEEKGNVLGLSFKDTSLERANDVLNTLINVYNESWRADRNQEVVSTSEFIDERLAVIEKELSSVDQNISDFKSSNQIPDVTAAGGMLMQEISSTSTELLALNNQLQVTRYLKEYIMREGNRYQVLPQNSGINNSSIESQIATYNSILMQRNAYKDNSSENHPLVIDADNRLAAIRQGILGSIDNQINALSTNIRNLQKEEDKNSAKISNNPRQERELLSVERQQKVKESLYLYLLEKREENELSQNFNASNSRVVMRPTGSSVPVSPDSRRIYMMAFVIGLAIPFGAISGIEFMNSKVRGRHDLDDLTVPLLGEIPYNGKPEKKHIQLFKKKVLNKGSKGSKNSNINGGIVVKEGKRNHVNEAFRVLRTNLGFVSEGKKDEAEVVMVTSFNPGSGKTFITMNLGVTLSLKRKRVLLIDGDLRRSTLSAYVGNPKKGISNYLVNTDMSLNDVIVPVENVKDLYMLPVGQVPPNPTELLESNRFKDMLAQLRNEFDYVIIDCPPGGMMADAQIINKLVDRTLFVVRVGVLERAMLAELQQLYDNKVYTNMGVILNGIPIDGSRYSYGYGYTYGYGYYSGYGYYDKESEE